MNKIIITALFLIIPFSFILLCSKKQIQTPESILQGKNAEENIGIAGNTVKESGVSDINKKTGTFNVTMGTYKGELAIEVKNGRFYGTIKFYNWGNGTPQPLKNLRINNDRIYFIRSITTKEELELYGGTAFFTQEFYGIFSSDGSLIRGYYRYLGAQDNWEARRK